MKISAQSVTESGTGSRQVRRVFAARLDHQVVLVRREILQLPRRQLKADSLNHMLSSDQLHRLGERALWRVLLVW